MERRNAERFDLELRFCLTTSCLPDGQLGGVTRNISTDGLLLRFELNAGDSAIALPVGEDVEVDLLLPRNRQWRQRSMHCFATLVWVRPAEAGTVLAGLRVHRMDFREFPPAARRNHRSPELHQVM